MACLGEPHCFQMAGGSHQNGSADAGPVNVDLTTIQCPRWSYYREYSQAHEFMTILQAMISWGVNADSEEIDLVAVIPGFACMFKGAVGMRVPS